MTWQRHPTDHAEAGFTLTELLIAAGAFVVILTAAMSLMVQWQRMTGKSEGDITAIEQGTRAIAQISDDVRLGMYLFHYATISIIGATGSASPYTYQIPIVTQNSTAELPVGLVQPDYFTTQRSPQIPNGAAMMGASSSGAIPMLALISDQPSGLSQPRYIIYWLGATTSTLLNRQDRTDAAQAQLSIAPLFRLEASPSSVASANTPVSWYTFRHRVNSTATSGITINLTNRTLTDWRGAAGAISIGYRFTKIADVVTGSGISNPFTLRNLHPYSNASLISPYEATISIQTSRAGRGGLRAGEVDIFRLNTNAFARNVPLPLPQL